MVEPVMTDLLSPNMKLLLLIGTPRYIRVNLRSRIWSAAILGATNSDPYVAVSTVACLLEYQSVGVPLTMWRMAVTAASDHVMVQVCIHMMYSGHILSSWLRDVRRDDLFWAPIDSS